MPDDYHPPMPLRNPEDIDLDAIKADLGSDIHYGDRTPITAMLATATMVTLVIIGTKALIQ